MSKHKSEDYKITAVKYYLDNETTYKILVIYFNQMY